MILLSIQPTVLRSGVYHHAWFMWCWRLNPELCHAREIKGVTGSALSEVFLALAFSPEPSLGPAPSFKTTNEKLNTSTFRSNFSKPNSLSLDS